VKELPNGKSVAVVQADKPTVEGLACGLESDEGAPGSAGFFMAESVAKLLWLQHDTTGFEDAAQRLGPAFELLRPDRPAARSVDGASSDTERASALLDAIGEGIALAGQDGSLHYQNSFCRALPDVVRDAISGFCQTSLKFFAERLGEALTPEQLTCKFEIEGPAPDPRVYEVFVTPAVSDQGRCVYGSVGGSSVREMAAVIRDVTPQRRSQQKMAAIDHAGFELVRLDTGAIRELNSMQRLKLLEDKIIRYSKDLLSFDHFAIFLIDEERQKLELVIEAGFPPEISDLSLFARTEGSGISGFVAATGRSYLCTDSDADDRFLPGLKGAKSSLTVPLRMQDRVIGVMDVESQQPHAFNDEDKLFAEIFARHIALALHMLDLLVVERSTTNTNVSDRVGDEVAEPLEDILREVEVLRQQASKDPEAAGHLGRIAEDVDAIRRRIRGVAEGPQSLLGVERAMQQRDPDPELAGRRLLVADDQEKIRKVIGEILTNRGCEVTTVPDGQEAIDLLDRVGAGDERPFDLVLSDIKMPDRNGYEVFSAVTRNTPGVPVILMTGFGYDPHHSIVRASQEGLHSVLFKPFEIDSLLEQIRGAFAASSG